MAMMMIMTMIAMMSMMMVMTIMAMIVMMAIMAMMAMIAMLVMMEMIAMIGDDCDDGDNGDDGMMTMMTTMTMMLIMTTNYDYDDVFHDDDYDCSKKNADLLFFLPHFAFLRSFKKICVSVYFVCRSMGTQKRTQAASFVQDASVVISRLAAISHFLL